ncbi:MAG: transporter, partial [Caulobacterales bacterium]|nr:transporter [Caulobacterales bacterium]
MALHLQVSRSRPSPNREPSAEAHLPYARHVSEHVIVLDNGAMMMSFQLEGASFETADVRDLNDWHAKLNSAWRNLADDRLAVWHHLVRRRHEVDAPGGYPEGSFRSAFAAGLDERYRQRLSATQMYVNALYVTLVLHPGRALSEKAEAWLSRGSRRGHRRDDVSELDGLRRIEEAGRDLAAYLGRYGLRRLGLYQSGEVWFSEPMELMRLVLTGRPHPVPIVRGHLGSAIYTSRLIFGREAIEIREPDGARFAAMFGVKEYPASTPPGLWNALLSARFPFVASQSFSFLSKTAARAVMERKQNQMLSARDRAASQVEGLSAALDELMSNRFAMGDHQVSLLVYGDDPFQLSEHLSKARAILADSGLVTAREDLGLEAAFWSQFPGAFARRVRPAAITSRNFAALAPFHTHPAGKRDGNHWGAAVALLRTSAGSPFHFNFHLGDLGHTFICGPSGSGKTVVQNFLLAELEKFGVQQVFIDKDRGAEIFVRACGGDYFNFLNGEPTGFAPMKALAFDAGGRAFLGQLVRQLVRTPNAPLSAQDERAIDEALLALAPLEPAARSFTALRALLGQRDADGVGARLEKWCAGGAFGWALDGEADEIGLTARFVGFDMTHLLDNVEVRTPIMLYLFHRLQGLVDGRRLVIDIDEFWKALGD